MEQEKNKNGVIALLVVIIVILLTLVILLATDTINLKSDVKCKDDNSTVVVDSEIDSALLNYLYDMLGINWEGTSSYSGDCLNYFLTDNNYRTVKNDYASNAQRVFSLYASHMGWGSKDIYNDSRCGTECKKKFSCAECTNILKKSADKVVKVYNLDTKYLSLSDIPDFDNYYAFSTGVVAGTCHYEVKHDLSSRYADSNTIEITDNQVVTDYVWPEGKEKNEINSTKEKNVTYTFKKDTDGDYHLDSVNVK